MRVSVGGVDFRRGGSHEERCCVDGLLDGEDVPDLAQRIDQLDELLDHRIWFARVEDEVHALFNSETRSVGEDQLSRRIVVP